MAPIKFEENIREKLESRSLQPSVDAWKKLEEKLNTNSKKRNKNLFWWFGIAASIVGFLFVINQFVTFDEINPITTPIIVNEIDDILKKPIKSSVTIEDVEQIAREETRSKEQLQLISNANDKAKNNKLKVKHKAIIKLPDTTKSEMLLKSQNQPEVSNQDLATDVSDLTDSSFTPKKTAIVSIVNSDSEIEALLVAAQKEIQLGDDKLKSIFKVDANALLDDVETEIPPSLRGQLFKVIEKNFKTAKTAVATRNE